MSKKFSFDAHDIGRIAEQAAILMIPFLAANTETVSSVLSGFGMSKESVALSVSFLAYVALKFSRNGQK